MAQLPSSCRLRAQISPAIVILLCGILSAQLLLHVDAFHSRRLADDGGRNSQRLPPGFARQGTARVTGGSSAARGQFPYMVALSHTSWFLECGGVLVHPRIVLTAAHCVDPAEILQGNPLVTHVHIGAYTVPTTNVEVKEVINVLPHPLFDTVSLDYDAALLILDSPSRGTPISIADESIDSALQQLFDGPNGNIMVTMGFGVVDPVNWISADTLQFADITYMERSVCRKKFARTQTDITERMLCAEVTSDGKDSCIGDSGSPLVMYRHGDGPERHILLGLTSFGSPTRCADPNFPGVYTRLSAMRSFILSVADTIDAAKDK